MTSYPKLPADLDQSIPSLKFKTNLQKENKNSFLLNSSQSPQKTSQIINFNFSLKTFDKAAIRSFRLPQEQEEHLETQMKVLWKSLKPVYESRCAFARKYFLLALLTLCTVVLPAYFLYLGFRLVCSKRRWIQEIKKNVQKKIKVINGELSIQFQPGQISQLNCMSQYGNQGFQGFQGVDNSCANGRELKRIQEEQEIQEDFKGTYGTQGTSGTLGNTQGMSRIQRDLKNQRNQGNQEANKDLDQLDKKNCILNKKKGYQNEQQQSGQKQQVSEQDELVIKEEKARDLLNAQCQQSTPVKQKHYPAIIYMSLEDINSGPLNSQNALNFPGFKVKLFLQSTLQQSVHLNSLQMSQRLQGMSHMPKLNLASMMQKEGQMSHRSNQPLVNDNLDSSRQLSPDEIEFAMKIQNEGNKHRSLSQNLSIFQKNDKAIDSEDLEMLENMEDSMQKIDDMIQQEHEQQEREQLNRAEEQKNLQNQQQNKKNIDQIMNKLQNDRQSQQFRENQLSDLINQQKESIQNNEIPKRPSQIAQTMQLLNDEQECDLSDSHENPSQTYNSMTHQKYSLQSLKKEKVINNLVNSPVKLGSLLSNNPTSRASNNNPFHPQQNNNPYMQERNMNSNSNRPKEFLQLRPQIITRHKNMAESSDNQFGKNMVYVTSVIPEQPEESNLSVSPNIRSMQGIVGQSSNSIKDRQGLNSNKKGLFSNYQTQNDQQNPLPTIIESNEKNEYFTNSPLSRKVSTQKKQNKFTKAEFSKYEELDEEIPDDNPNTANLFTRQDSRANRLMISTHKEIDMGKNAFQQHGSNSISSNPMSYIGLGLNPMFKPYVNVLESQVIQTHGTSSQLPRTTVDDTVNNQQKSSELNFSRHKMIKNQLNQSNMKDKKWLKKSESVYPQEQFQDSDSVQLVISNLSKAQKSQCGSRRKIQFNYASFN